MVQGRNGGKYVEERPSGPGASAKDRRPYRAFESEGVVLVSTAGPAYGANCGLEEPTGRSFPNVHQGSGQAAPE